MPTNLFNPGPMDTDENLGATIMEQGYHADEARFAGYQRRVGLYILHHFTWPEAEEFFDMLDLPTKEMTRWKEALDRAQMMPEPIAEVEHSPVPTPRATPEKHEPVMINSRPGVQNGSAKVTDKIVRAIRTDYDNHNYLSLTELGRRYGLSRTTVTGIARRLSWTHVTEPKKTK